MTGLPPSHQIPPAEFLPLFGKPMKRELVYLLGLAFSQGVAYSAAQVERVVQDNVRPGIRDQPLLSIDHLRVALVEFSILDRDPRRELYTLSPNYRGLSLPTRDIYLWLDRCETELPEQRIPCPYCKRRPAKAPFIRRHIQAQHRERVLNELYWHRFLARASSRLEAWFR